MANLVMVAQFIMASLGMVVKLAKIGHNPKALNRTKLPNWPDLCGRGQLGIRGQISHVPKNIKWPNLSA
jgi:hypothetical protein